MTDNHREMMLIVPGQNLGDFIMSLLGQPRTIERTFSVPHLLVPYEWIVNTIDRIDQRVCSQNIAEIASFKCEYYYKAGRLLTIHDIDNFRAFNDNSPEETIGIDVNITYLVKFGKSTIPEKQDIRIEIFSDTSMKTHLQSDSTNSPGLKYTISSTNFTWAEDLATNIDNQLRQLTRPDKLARLNLVLDKIVKKDFAILSLFLLIFCSFMFTIMYTQWIDTNERTKFISNQLASMGNTVSLNLINKKLDLVLTNLNHYDLAFLSRLLNIRLGAAIMCFAALFITWVVIRKHANCYVVACNEFTKAKLNAIKKFRESVMWAIYVALAVGIVAGVIATRVDNLLFG